MQIIENTEDRDPNGCQDRIRRVAIEPPGPYGYPPLPAPQKVTRMGHMARSYVHWSKKYDRRFVLTAPARVVAEVLGRSEASVKMFRSRLKRGKVARYRSPKSVSRETDVNPSPTEPPVDGNPSEDEVSDG